MNNRMDLDADAVQSQLKRVLSSKTFETSEVHRHLLEYLAEKTLSGESDRLKEYTVGLEAFGKPPSYDPRSDSIVRLQVGRVRQKLMAYYQTEAAPDEPLITLPKGGFKLTFDAPHTARPAVPVRTRLLVPALATALVAVAVWAALATFGLIGVERRSGLQGHEWTPELEALWGPLLQSNRSLLICLGTPLFVRFPNFGFLRNPRINDWAEAQNSPRMKTLEGAGGGEMYPAYPFTGAGEASAAFLLGKLLASRRPDILLTRSNLLSWQQIADQNLVFLGPPKFNPQLQAAVMNQDIVVEADGVRNLKPLPGEPAFLDDRIVPGKWSEGETHAVISRMQGISGIGELLIIAGNASPDTMAAAEWLTQPWRARELVNRLRTPSGALPKSYQVVLKVTFKQGIPLRSTYVFHHAAQ